MASITGSLVYKTVSLYKNFLDSCGLRFAADTEEEMRDKKNLAKLEKQRAYKNKQTEIGIADEEKEGFNSWAEKFFKKRGVKTNGSSKGEFKNFANYVHSNLSRNIPKIISEKVKEEYGLNIAPKNLNIDKEKYREALLVGLFKFLENNPDKIDDALVKAHVSKDQLARIDRRTGKPVEESLEDSEKRNMDIEELGFAQSYFVPKADEMTLKKLGEKGVDISEMKIGSVDKYALAVLKEKIGKNIKWKFKGFDENRIDFTLPELFGDRKFVITLPFDVAQIRDPEVREDLKDAFKEGTYNFRVKNVGKNGAILQFVEQGDLLKKRILPTLQLVGLDKREISNFINTIAYMYRDSFKSLSLEEIGETFGKGFELKPGLVSEANNIAELIEMGDKGDLEKLREQEEDPKAERGVEEAVKKVEESKGLEHSKQLASVQALSRLQALQIQLAKKGDNDSFRELIGHILDYLPNTVQKRGGRLGIVSLLQTKPISSYLLKNIIFDKHTPTEVSGGGSQPWIRLAENWLKNEAHTDPKIRKLVSDYVYLLAREPKKKPKDKKSPIQPVTKKEEPSDSKIQNLLMGKNPAKEHLSPETSGPSEKKIQDTLRGKMAAGLDIDKLNQLFKSPSSPKKKKMTPAPNTSAPTAPTAPTAPGPSMKGEVPSTQPSEEELIKRYEEKLKPGEKETPEEEILPTRGEVMTPQEVQSFLRGLELIPGFRLYRLMLLDLIKNELSDDPLVQKALERKRTFDSYLKSNDLYKYIADYLNKDLIKLEAELSKINDSEGLSPAQIDEYDANEEKAKELVDRFMVDEKSVKKDVAEKIREFKKNRLQKAERNAAEQQNNYKTVVAYAFRKLKCLEKDS